MSQLTSDGIALGIVGQVSESLAIVTSEGGERTHAARAAGMEWRAMSEGGPRARISELLDLLTAALGLRDRCELILRTRSLAVAVSGIDSRFSTSLFRQSLINLGFDGATVTVASLAEAAHLGAFLGGPGLLVRCGHGTSACIRTPAGSRRLLGGWGSAAGDRGSGPWLGRKALIAATRVLDGNAAEDEAHFVQHLSAACKVGHPLALVEHLEAQRYWTGELGIRQFLNELGGRTIRLAEVGDPYATALVDRSLVQLIDTVRSAMKLHANSVESIPTCFRGGILENYPYYCRKLATRLVHEFPCLTLASLGCRGMFPTIIGAGLLALGFHTSAELAQTAIVLAHGLIEDQLVAPRKKDCCLLPCPLTQHPTITMPQ